MNKIWLFIIAFCFVYAIATNNLDSLIDNILDVPQESLQLLLKVGGLIVIYNGIFNIAIASGIIDRIGKLFRKLSYLLFPSVPKSSKIHDYVCSNITANLLGLGIASTPIALKTIKEMKKINNDSPKASREMITLIVLNITCFTIFPLTVISIREKYNSLLGVKIWLSLIIITFTVSVISLIINAIIARMNKWNT